MAISLGSLESGEMKGPTGNLCNVVLLDPRVPVVDERIACSVVILVLAKCPLVNDSLVPRVFEKRWCYLLALHHNR
jgi:hypothetical protein